MYQSSGSSPVTRTVPEEFKDAERFLRASDFYVITTYVSNDRDCSAELECELSENLNV